MHELSYVNLLKSLGHLLVNSEQSLTIANTLNKADCCSDVIIDTISAHSPELSSNIQIIKDNYKLQKEKLNRFGLSNPTPHPMTGHIEKLVRVIWGAILNKINVEIIIDKLPNAHSYPDLGIILSKQNIKLRQMLVIRNPLDTINSSISRRNGSLKKLDFWHIDTVDDAINEWILNWNYAVKESINSDCLLLKYENVCSDFEEQSDRIAKFIGIENNFHDITVTPPVCTRFHALTDDEIGYIRAIFEKFEALWANLSISELVIELGLILPEVKVEQEVKFGLEHCVPTLFLEGFSEPEAFWCWTKQSHARIRFRIKNHDKSDDLHISFSFFTYLRPGRHSVFFIQVNGAEVVKISIPSELAMQPQTIKIPFLIYDETIDIRVYLPSRKQPHEPPLEDNRELAVAFQSIVIRHG